ncbi:hypothetical protein Y887_10560 [Xanthomonas pisi DSM 18956]|nr:hypothetical protein Y887_10560 [Xanthomonas pisi DSM 18956]
MIDCTAVACGVRVLPADSRQRSRLPGDRAVAYRPICAGTAGIAQLRSAHRQRSLVGRRMDGRVLDSAPLLRASSAAGLPL